MVLKEKPKDFNPKFEIVSCFLEYKEKFVLLLRQDSKPQGDTWGVPAGKMDPGESPLAAMQRELKEETGYQIGQNLPKLEHTVYVRYPDYDFTYHIFYLILPKKHEVLIDSESHKGFKWVTP